MSSRVGERGRTHGLGNETDAAAKATVRWEGGERCSKKESSGMGKGDLSDATLDPKWRSDFHGCQMAIAGFLDRMCLALQARRTMAPLRCAAKFDPFLSLDCAPWRNPRKGRDQILQHSVAEP